jgi:hypothetical protein
MAISQTKQAQLTTPEAVYDQPLAPRPNGTNSGKNGLSAGAITGMAVSGVVACALSFVVGMHVGGSRNNNINNQAGGPPSMSRTQNSQPGGPGGQTGGAVRQVLTRTRLVKAHKYQQGRITMAQRQITKPPRRHRLTRRSHQPPTPHRRPINRW